jgi:predicted house-cleaning noncanonical NTP pyrophosphatase (MazG superfamily)
LDEADYKVALLEKLVEEAREVLGTVGEKKELVREIGDVLEVVDALVEAYGLERSQIEELKVRRAKERGAFKKRLFLESEG